MRFFILCFALLVSASCSLPAFAQEKAVPPLPAPLKTMVEEGAQIRYLGNDLGLDGWVTIKNAQEQYFYVTPDQQGLVMGVLFNSKGDTVTLRQINQLRKTEGPAIDKLAGLPDAAPPPSREANSTPEIAAPEKDLPKDSSEPSKSEKFYAEVEKANWLALGQKTAPALYVFIDPECPHCHDMISDVRKSGYLEKGLIQLRLIPVGLMNENSLAEASFLLAAPNAEELLYKHLDGDKKALLADKNINTQGVQRNMSLMQDWKLDVTPFSIYRDVTGKIKILKGRPDDLKKLVAELR